MRPECLECVRKHLGSASSNIYETLTSYPEHVTYVAGELDQACQEAMRKYPEFALRIRSFRIEYEKAVEDLLLGAPLIEVVQAMPDVHELVLELHELWLKELLAEHE